MEYHIPLVKLLTHISNSIPAISCLSVSHIYFHNSSDYIIVGGHHPVLSAGSHGSHPCLLSKLKPLMEKYGVTAYFSGHDHNLQVIMTFFITFFISFTLAHQRRLLLSSLHCSITYRYSTILISNIEFCILLWIYDSLLNSLSS